MIVVDKTTQVKVPASLAYRQWTQFEEFPRFMQDVDEVRRLDNLILEWRTHFAEQDETWHAEIIELRRDQCIAWRSLGGRRKNVRVTFTPLDANTSRVMLHVEYEPTNVLEDCGPTLGTVEKRVENDLKRFRELIEGRSGSERSWKIGKKIYAPGGAG